MLRHMLLSPSSAEPATRFYCCSAVEKSNGITEVNQWAHASPTMAFSAETAKNDEKIDIFGLLFTKVTHRTTLSGEYTIISQGEALCMGSKHLLLKVTENQNIQLAQQAYQCTIAQIFQLWESRHSTTKEITASRTKCQSNKHRHAQCRQSCDINTDASIHLAGYFFEFLPAKNTKILAICTCLHIFLH